MNSLKAQGFKKGFPDLIVFAKNKTYNALFLEFKKAKGGVLSPEQKEWQIWLNSNGYCARVAKGCRNAIEILDAYLNDNL